MAQGVGGIGPALSAHGKMNELLRTTPFHDWHLAHGARMAAFAGWEMPLHYGSQLQEHHAVRQAAGFFDVSHMRPLDVWGPDARALLRYALANDIARLDDRPGKGLYSTMLRNDGGILDDLIVFHLSSECYRLVLNAATAVQDLEYLQSLAHLQLWQVRFLPRDDWGILAVQGPRALSLVSPLLGVPALQNCPRFQGLELESSSLFVARTGYTGEDGVEILGTPERLLAIADALHAQGVAPAGLAARDSLRLEAGLLLYGQDMGPADSPDRSHLAWTVDLRDPKRDFSGRAAIAKERHGILHQQLWGLVLSRHAIPRTGYEVLAEDGQIIGTVTSGLFSPSLGRGIALARLAAPYGPGMSAQVRIRHQVFPASIVEPPFWRQGKAVYPL